MTSLHKAGLAGLFMTLRALDEKKRKIDGLEWTPATNQITLNWTKDDQRAAFKKLVENSFSVENHFVRFTGMEIDREPSIEQKEHIATALLNTFFQHGKHRSTGKKQALRYQEDMDGKLCWIRNFAPILEIKPYAQAVAEFIDDNGTFKESLKVAGWLYPGAGRRHGDNTRFSEPVENALALMYAPIGVVFYRLRSRMKGRKARVAMVVPDIRDLESYCELRRIAPMYETLEMTASSASDAALRFVTEIAGGDARKSLSQTTGSNGVHCRVFTFGIVPWNEQQKTRTFSHSVFSEKVKGLENYNLANAIFRNRWQTSKEEKDRRGTVTKPESFYVSPSTAREFISENIANGNHWYHDLATWLSRKEVRKGLSYRGERERLNRMVKEAQFDDETERLFINVCQESWRRRMGKVSERATASGADPGKLIQKEFERLRLAVSHSRNAHRLRETIVDFWARSGGNEELQGNGLLEVLPLFDENNWRKARDLALLSLISYQPKTPKEKQLLSEEETERDEDNE